MKKMKICGIFLLCMLVAGCSTDIEQEVVDNSETEQESIETEAEQETERRDLYEEDEEGDTILARIATESAHLFTKIIPLFQSFEKKKYKQHFDLKTGICLEDDSVALKTYKVQVDGEQVSIYS